MPIKMHHHRDKTTGDLYLWLHDDDGKLVAEINLHSRKIEDLFTERKVSLHLAANVDLAVDVLEPEEASS